MNQIFHHPRLQYIKIALLLIPLNCTDALAKEAENEHSPRANLQNNLEKMADYYQQVNDKLNNQGANKKPRQSNDILPNSRRDPFAYTEQMYRNQQKQLPEHKQNPLTSNGFLLTNMTADGLPVMKYRGYAESPSGEAIGLLEILGMGTYTVRMGDKIGLHDIVKELVLVVEGLSRNNIIVKTGKLGKKLVIQ